jgi:negative regulator of replication initiation
MADTRDVETKVRTVRIDDDLWAQVQDVTKAQGESVADVFRRALRAYVADPNAFDAAIAQVRAGAQRQEAS